MKSSPANGQFPAQAGPAQRRPGLPADHRPGAGRDGGGTLAAGDQLPTVRQLAVDLAINPNTVMRAYRELELGGMLETQQGTGTFISDKKVSRNDAERERQLDPTGRRDSRPAPEPPDSPSKNCSSNCTN